MTPQIFFFPFTHVTEKQLTEVTAVFQHIHCLALEKEQAELEPGKTIGDSEHLTRLFPSDEEMARVDQATAQYLNWAKIHQGNETNLKALLKPSAYFTDDTHVSSIKSQLSGARNGEPKAENSDPQSNDLIFLKLAQHSDAQQDGIETELAQVEKNNQNLLNALKGADTVTVDEEKTAVPLDAGARMTKERIESWSRVMDRKGMLNSDSQTPVLVTTSPSVFDWFEINTEMVNNPLDIQNLKVHNRNCVNKNEWQAQFNHCLADAIHKEAFSIEEIPEVADGCQSSVRMKLGLFSQKSKNPLLISPGKQIPVCLVQLK